jgi:hypothetical protein
MLWKSSSTTVSGAPNVAMPFTSSITALSTPPEISSCCNAPRPRPWRTRSTAVAAYVQNRTGSLSPASSVSQATAPDLLSYQARAATVFPYPGGAATSVSITSSRARTVWMRGRATISARSLGSKSLVSASGSVSYSMRLAIFPVRPRLETIVAPTKAGCHHPGRVICG